MNNIHAFSMRIAYTVIPTQAPDSQSETAIIGLGDGFGAFAGMTQCFSYVSTGSVRPLSPCHLLLDLNALPDGQASDGSVTDRGIFQIRKISGYLLPDSKCGMMRAC